MLLDRLCVDLAAERASLSDIVLDASPEEWLRPTRAVGWMVRDQLAHLLLVDEWATLAIADPDKFEALLRSRAREAITGEHTYLLDDRSSPREFIDRWGAAGRALEGAARSAPTDLVVPWSGPSMKVTTMLTARLMETWAHGDDVTDCLGIRRFPTARLRHVASLGFRTRAFSFRNRGLRPPVSDVYVRLQGPAGESWNFGDETAPEQIAGSALDFCRVVTRRRHFRDTDLSVAGKDAIRWMEVAQAFAGSPGPDPERRRLHEHS